MSKILYSTGLTKTVLEYIENVSFSDEIKTFERVADCCNYIEHIFRIKFSESENKNILYNMYWCKNCSELLFLGNQGVGHGYQKFTAEYLTKYISNLERTDLCFGSDILHLKLSKQFYAEYEIINDEQKKLVSRMLLTYGKDIYMEFLKSNKTEEITYAFALHVDEKEENFHIHRLYSRKFNN